MLIGATISVYSTIQYKQHIAVVFSTSFVLQSPVARPLYLCSHKPHVNFLAKFTGYLKCYNYNYCCCTRKYFFDNTHQSLINKIIMLVLKNQLDTLWCLTIIVTEIIVDNKYTTF